FVGNGNSQLVLHELSIAGAGKRPDARHHRDAAVLNLAQELFQQANIEDRLGDGQLCARLHFVFEAADLLVNVRAAGIGAHGDDELGRAPDGIAADVQAAVQVVDDVDQADGVHIEDGGGVGIVAHLGRIAG